MQRRASFHLRFPLKYKTWLAPAESTNPKRDGLVEPHLSKNESGHPPKNKCYLEL
jgi:hypothetical protein